MATRAQIQELVDQLVAGYDPDKVILFGSHAYGTPGPDSDVDLFVIKDDPRPRMEREVEARLTMRRRKIPVDVLVYTPSELASSSRSKYNGLIQDVVNKGQVFYERGR